MFDKILIANRGEIALRIIRACRELKIQSVAVYSEADKDSLHVKMADQAICIGPPHSKESYLNISNIIEAAKLVKAEAIHPGYGFLSENTELVKACEEENIVFIGPSVEAMEKMGIKAVARETMQEAGVPVVPGSKGVVEDIEELLTIANSIGYPVMVKASFGGGGRGMRIAYSDSELEKAFRQARAEAKTSFGNSEVYLEKFVEKPRHIEFQILGDKFGNYVHLGERDCSVQRRNQKMIEESPSVALSPALRKEMGEASLKAARAANYWGAGTVEFLLDKEGNYYFIEMNTRIQVEHPVTEMVTGMDLIKEQILVANGEPLQFSQEDININGWAIECRINAEDPDNNFIPYPGTITSYYLPGGIGVRVDSVAHAGFKISPFYDSMIAKLICWGRDRKEALQRMERALMEFKLEGIKNTIPFHLKVLQNEFFQRGDINTHFIQDRILPQDE